MILSCGYIVYIVIMYFNPYLSKRAEEIGAKWRRRDHHHNYPSSEDTVSLLSDQHNDVLYGTTAHSEPQAPNSEAQTPNSELSGRHSYGAVSDYGTRERHNMGAYIEGEGRGARGW